jgi:hypothetical protein
MKLARLLAYCKFFCYICIRVSLFGAVLVCVTKTAAKKKAAKVGFAELKGGGSKLIRSTIRAND